MSAKCKICSESGRLTHRISNQHHRRPSIGSWYWFISGQQIMFSCAVRGTNPLHHYPSISSTNHCMMQRDSKQQQKLQINKPPLSSAPILFPLPAPSSNSSSSSTPCGQPGSRAQPVHRQLTTHLSLLFSLHFTFSAAYCQSFSPYLPVCGLTRLGCVGFSFQLQLESCRFVDVADLSSMEVWQYQ